jgi:hypothetical protein
MHYKFVWGDGNLEYGSGMLRTLHHVNLLEKLMDKYGPIENYVGGTFSEDTRHDGQFDSVSIEWPGEGDVPSPDELKQLMQMELGRYRFDNEQMIAQRVAAMKEGYDNLESYEVETGKDHERLYPYIWYDGNAFIGDPRTGHNGLVEDWYNMLIAPFSDYDYTEIPDTYYIGRVTRQGELISWDGKYPTPLYVQDAVRKKLFSRMSATSEDTEPEGLMVGFLRDPHETLYPPLFDGAEPKPKALQVLKNHVLNQLSLNHYDDADYWINFSIFGSGISFNWDELGDMDIQMWVDVDKFNEKHPNETFTADELVAEVRRIVQMVNFPSFHELGLSTDDVKGDMLIQYYPKPGKGTEEENLASKPYACYDMDNARWLQRPKPINPRFYGEHFLMVMTKAEEIAKQAEALLEQLNRNTTNWQFWSMLYHKYRNDKYLDQVELAERNAEAEKLGVQELFQGVFGGRAEAYSEEGKGIEDERDIVQKLLEVWGIFQRLKHFARQPLPWEEQELPAPPSERGREGPTEGEESDNEYDVDEPVHPTTLTAAKGDAEGYYPYAYNEITGNLYVGYDTSGRGVNDSHDELIDRMIDAGYMEVDGDWDEWNYGYVGTTGENLDFVEPWSDFFRGAENIGAAEQQVRSAWPMRKEAAWPFKKKKDKANERLDELARKRQELLDRWQDIEKSYAPSGPKLNDPVKTYEPYSQWDFRVQPGDPIPPIGALTRWQWSPTSGLHVWNPPEGGREIYHMIYGDQLPNGREEMDNNDQPSGYILSMDRVFAYGDASWYKWNSDAKAAIEAYLGGPVEITNNMADRGTDQGSSMKWLNDEVTPELTPDQQAEAELQWIAWMEEAGQENWREIRPDLAEKFSRVVTAEWQDIMENAKSLLDEGAVQIANNGATHVEGTVASQSEPGQSYETSFERDDPASSAITTWNCSCPWGEVSWGRTRQWKKYEGRPCKHTLAMYWQSLSQPLDEDRPEAQGQGQLFNPAELNDGGFQPAPGPGGPNMGQPQAPQQPQQQAPPAPPPPPNPSVITAPGQGGTVSIPGTFSANDPFTTFLRSKGWQQEVIESYLSQGELPLAVVEALKADIAEYYYHSSKLKQSDFEFVSAFNNGQVVRAKMPMWGVDRDDNMQMVPQGTLGEVLWSDEAECIVIFPLDSGALEPHLVRVKDGAGNFAPTRAKTPFVKRVR